jgi:2-dehydro-3-deoxygalactonokinase
MKYLLNCDWGTTNFRLKLFSTGSGEVLEQAEAPDGVSTVYQQWKLSGQPREPFYLSIIHKHLESLKRRVALDLAGIPILISGMASSSLGIRELAYAGLPFNADGSSAVTAIITAPHFSHPVYLISGLRSADDVMRGEETQWVGLMQIPALDHHTDLVFILPGTHSKHISASRGQVVSFKTYMTGEFFHLLTTQSVLKNSVETGHPLLTEEDEQSFLSGVRTATAGIDASQSNLLHDAFLVRTNDLFTTLDKKQNAFFLSGLLIGSELKGVEKAHIVLASGPAQSKAYELALRELVGQHKLIILSPDAVEKATIQGQIKIVKELIEL